MGPAVSSPTLPSAKGGAPCCWNGSWRSTTKPGPPATPDMFTIRTLSGSKLDALFAALQSQLSTGYDEVLYEVDLFVTREIDRRKKPKK